MKKILAAGCVEVGGLDWRISCKEGIFIVVYLVGGISRQPFLPIGQIIGGSRFNSIIKLYHRRIIHICDI